PGDDLGIQHISAMLRTAGRDSLCPTSSYVVRPAPNLIRRGGLKRDDYPETRIVERSVFGGALPHCAACDFSVQVVLAFFLIFFGSRSDTGSSLIRYATATQGWGDSR